ncbi:MULTISPECIES: hypothetical protein [Pseudomonas]|uniref:hypothetical protein n=1 Tax=Pseudomonas TaxID=286 RepID=UPI0011136DB8|nr:MULTISPECIES: hypothetical protein [Pseudomonas]
MNHEIHTPTAKAADRAALSVMMAMYDGPVTVVESAQVKPLPPRKHPEPSKSKRSRTKDAKPLATAELFAVVPVADVQQALGYADMPSWPFGVPKRHEEFLRTMMTVWPTLKRAKRLIESGNRLARVAKLMGADEEELSSLLDSHNIFYLKD